MKQKLILGALSAAVTLAACSLAPAYKTPVTAAPAAVYKEAEGWKPAQPADTVPRGAWWNVFHDARLDSLEAQVTSSNQNVKAAFARLEQARAQVRYVRASYLPTVSGRRCFPHAHLDQRAPIQHSQAAYAERLPARERCVL